jgi:hypothetical protein
MDSRDETYTQRENQWDEQWPDTGQEQTGHSAAELDNTDEMMPFPGEVGTSDPIAAVRDAEPYMPPIDPPVLPDNVLGGGGEGIAVATGFGVSPEEEAYEDRFSSSPLPRSDADIEDEATLLLRQDSLTSTLPLRVQVENGVVRLTGEVQSTDEADHASWILGELAGVDEVIDDTSLAPTGAE